MYFLYFLCYIHSFHIPHFLTRYTKKGYLKTNMLKREKENEISVKEDNNVMKSKNK